MLRLVGRGPSTCFREAAELVELDVPVPAPNEVLVKVTHVGINGGCETFRCRAEFAFAGNRQLRNFPLGAEGCGVVCAIGEGVRRLKPGDAVAFTAGGAFSEYVAVKAGLCDRVPSSSPEAVALILSGMTASCALEVTGRVGPEDTVLVTAAAGGTGHFAVQLAKLAGAHVVATCGGAAKAGALRGLGVNRVIDHTQEDVSTALAQEYPQRLTLVYEGVGGALRQAALANLAEGGRLLQVGYISEYPHTRSAGSHHTAAAAAAGTSTATAQGPGGASSSRDVPISGGVTSSSGVSCDEGIGGDSDACSTTASAHGTAAGVPPPAEELFWGNQDFAWGSRRIIGKIFPKDLKAMPRARRRMLQLHSEGRIQVWVDSSHSFRGLQSIPDAVEHMLHGRHVGKVVVPL